MNKLPGFFLFAIIVTIMGVVVITSCWIVNTIGPQNSNLRFTLSIATIISAIMIVVVAVLAFLMTLLDIRKQSVTYEQKPTSPIKITLEIDDTPTSLEAPDVESASKLLEVLRTKKSGSMTKDIYDFPEFP
jgi:hypothetical protein